MGTCEGRDGSCDWFSWVVHILCTGCILPRELRWFKEWFKAQWPGVIMSEALWDTPRAWKALYKNGLLLLLLLLLAVFSLRTQHAEPKPEMEPKPRFEKGPRNRNKDHNSERRERYSLATQGTISSSIFVQQNIVTEQNLCILNGNIEKQMIIFEQQLIHFA